MARRIPRPGFRGKLALTIVLIVALTVGLAFFAVYRSTDSELRAAAEDDLVFKAREISNELRNTGPADAGAYRGEAQEIAADLPVEAESIIVAISIGGVLATNQPEVFAATGPLAVDGPSNDGGSPAGSALSRATAVALEEVERRSGQAAEVTDFGREDDQGAKWEVEVTRDDGVEYDVYVDENGAVVRVEEKGRDEGDDGEDGRDGLEDKRRFLEAPEGFSEQRLEELGNTLELTTTVPLPGSEEAIVRVAKSLGPTDEALEELSGTFVRLGLVALFVSAVLAWLLASRLTGPLRRLTSLSGEVAGDDLAVRMPLDEAGSDELRKLAVSFNQMLDRLEGAFERQKEFVADASHDLRTPLTIVRGQIEVLARDPDPSPEEVARVSAAVQEAVGRMEVLVDDLLLLARSDSDRRVELQRLEIGPLLEVEREGRVEAERERIEIGEVTDREIEFDPEAISRAVSNLVENALRHGGSDGRVRLSAAPAGDGIAITVDDDGPGVPEGERERIFDRFARLDRARSSDTGGSGLGLAIVRTLVEAGGGSVSCSNSPLGGARFEVRLPGRVPG